MSEANSQNIRGGLYLDVSARLCLDPTELMEKYSGQLILNTQNGRFLVGNTRYWVVRVNEMLNHHLDPSAMLDGEDTDTADFCELFAKSGGDWTKAVYRVCPDAMFGDLAIVDRLIVYPPFRGKKIGLHCIEMIMRITGGMALFVLKPFPLQHNPHYAKQPGVARQAKSLKADLEKLFGYYEQNGFKKVPGTGRMALDPRTINSATAWKDGDGDVCMPRTDELEKYRFLEPNAKEEWE